MIFASAITKWHALGVSAWVNSHIPSSTNVSGCMLIRPHSITGYLLDQEDIGWAVDTNVRVIRYDGDRSLLENLLLLVKLPLLTLLVLRNKVSPPKQPIYIASPVMTPWVIVLDNVGIYKLLRRGVNVARLDEGFSSYIPASMWSTKLARENRGGSSSGFLRLVKHRIESVRRWLLAQLDLILSYEDRLLFDVDESRQLMIAKEKVVSEYAREIHHLANNTTQRSLEVTSTGALPVLLLLTQPWSEGDELTAEKELVLLRRVIEIGQSRGYTIHIKVHPRERKGKYSTLVSHGDTEEVVLLDGDAVAEEVFAELREQDIVVGFFSTALLTAKLFYGRNAYVVPEKWLEDVGAPEDLVDNQSLFCRYTREILSDFDH